MNMSLETIFSLESEVSLNEIKDKKLSNTTLTLQVGSQEAE